MDDANMGDCIGSSEEENDNLRRWNQRNKIVEKEEANSTRKKGRGGGSLSRESQDLLQGLGPRKQWRHNCEYEDGCGRGWGVGWQRSQGRGRWYLIRHGYEKGRENWGKETMEEQSNHQIIRTKHCLSLPMEACLGNTVNLGSKYVDWSCQLLLYRGIINKGGIWEGVNRRTLDDSDNYLHVQRCKPNFMANIVEIMPLPVWMWFLWNTTQKDGCSRQEIRLDELSRLTLPLLEPLGVNLHVFVLRWIWISQWRQDIRCEGGIEGCNMRVCRIYALYVVDIITERQDAHQNQRKGGRHAVLLPSQMPR